MGDQPRRRTLLCVLDWGLGHASRSLALLDHPLLAGGEVILASSGEALALLRRERPDLQSLALPPYAVRYPTRNMPLNVALQFPRWLSVIWRERRCIEKWVGAMGIDRVVSDNRFGCYSSAVPSVFLTHQLHPITGLAAVNGLYRTFLRPFSEFWVPDTAGRALSGKLSDGRGYENVRYIGPLSRLPAVAADGTRPVRTLSILSGPEPMRGRLEVELLSVLPGVPGRHHIIRGTRVARNAAVAANIRVTDFADRAMLAAAIAEAETVICRSGYSTLMDLVAVGFAGRLVLIPTPGQTEQIYLAERLDWGGGKVVLGRGALGSFLAGFR